jgi:hypothetical protein
MERTWAVRLPVRATGAFVRGGDRPTAPAFENDGLDALLTVSKRGDGAPQSRFR